MKTSFIRSERGFTLLELLVVIGLIAGLSFFLIGDLGGGKSAALQSSQAILANLVAAARTQAQAGGDGVRLLIAVDPAATEEPSRFLRHAVIQIQIAGAWQPEPVVEVSLPEGVYVVPGNFSSLPAGLFAVTATPWTKTDGSPLRSTALRANQLLALAINGSVAEQWVAIHFAATGTTAQPGDLVLATGRRRPPGSYAAGESPVELENPETVCGLTLSTYGLPVLISDRAGF